MMRSTIFLMMLALGAGCAGGESDAVSAASTAYVGHAEPLIRVEHRLWNAAPAGCEGHLATPGLRWGVASGAPELVVALFEGAAICVDTYSAVESELAAIDSPDLDGLWAGYVATLQELEPHVTHQQVPTGNLQPLSGVQEPEPQPSLEFLPTPTPGLGIDLGIALGVDLEPEPQPSDQPSASTGGSGTASSSGESNSTSMGPPPPREEPRRP